MTNEQYRKQRGTAKPFKTTPEQAKMAWRELMKDEIAEGRKRRARATRAMTAYRAAALRGAAAVTQEED